MKTQYLVAVATVVVTGGAIAWQAASTALSAPTPPSVASKTAHKKTAPVVDGVMRPSEFPGVEIVSIPDPPAQPTTVRAAATKDKNLKKSADGKSWIRVLPGGKIPEGGYSARNETTWRRENGKTPLGGIALIPDQNYLLHEVVRRDKSGALVHKCTPGESAAQHAQHQHAQTKANQPVVKNKR